MKLACEPFNVPFTDLKFYRSQIVPEFTYPLELSICSTDTPVDRSCLFFITIIRSKNLEPVNGIAYN